MGGGALRLLFCFPHFIWDVLSSFQVLQTEDLYGFGEVRKWFEGWAWGC